MRIYLLKKVRVMKMPDDEKKEKDPIDSDEVEIMLDVLWKNLETRCKCEKTHLPRTINFKKTIE